MPELADWVRGIVLMGWDGDEYRAILLDDAGNINALLRGQYGDELRTVALDDEGRISAFVIDSADAWGRLLSVGNAELAARLGSANRYEQRGHVQLIESFESGLGRWHKYPGQADASIELDPTHCVTGGYCVKLTTCKLTPWYSMIQHQEAVLATTRYGLEMSFALNSQIDYFDLRLGIFDGTKIHRGGFRYHHNNLKLYVRTGDTTWAEDEAVVARAVDGEVFSRMKFVIDTETGKYVRGFLDDVEYSLGDHSLYVTTVANVPRAVINIYLYGDAGENQIAYLDDVILTSAEQ